MLSWPLFPYTWVVQRICSDHLRVLNERLSKLKIEIEKDLGRMEVSDNYAEKVYYAAVICSLYTQQRSLYISAYHMLSYNGMQKIPDYISISEKWDAIKEEVNEKIARYEQYIKRHLKEYMVTQ